MVDRRLGDLVATTKTARVRAPTAPADAVALSQAELNHALARKAESEARVAESGVSRRSFIRDLLSSTAGLGSVFVALGTLAAGVFAIVQWFDTQSNDSDAKAEAQFTTAVQHLTGDDVKGQLGGLVTLASYLDGTDKARAQRALFVIANAVP